jgi:hypothetical protein
MFISCSCGGFYFQHETNYDLKLKIQTGTIDEHHQDHSVLHSSMETHVFVSPINLRERSSRRKTMACFSDATLTCVIKL